MLMKAETSTLLIVDIQQKLVPALDRAAALVEHSLWLSRVARRLDVPLLVSEQYPQGLGPTVAELQPLLEGAPILEKLHFSAAREPDLFLMPGGDRAQFVVCGCEAHICVLQTVLDLLAQGRQVFVVAEAVASRQPANKALALERMRQAGAAIVSREMVAYEWLERAGSELFRAVSREYLR